MAPGLWRFAALAAVGTALVVGFYVFAEGHGYARAAAQYERAMREQEDANRAAVRRAEERYLRAIDEAAQRKQELDDAMDRLAEEALADPDADGLGVSARGVQRLNQVR